MAGKRKKKKFSVLLLSETSFSGSERDFFVEHGYARRETMLILSRGRDFSVEEKKEMAEAYLWSVKGAEKEDVEKYKSIVIQMIEEELSKVAV